jgi:hypothetical protein
MNKYDLSKNYFKAAELSRLPQLSPGFLPAFQQFQAAMAQAADMEREMEALDTRSRHAMRTRSQEDPDWIPSMSDIDSFLEDAIANNVEATEAAMKETSKTNMKIRRHLHEFHEEDMDSEEEDDIAFLVSGLAVQSGGFIIEFPSVNHNPSPPGSWRGWRRGEEAGQEVPAKEAEKAPDVKKRPRTEDGEGGENAQKKKIRGGRRAVLFK